MIRAHIAVPIVSRNESGDIQAALDFPTVICRDKAPNSPVDCEQPQWAILHSGLMRERLDHVRYVLVQFQVLRRCGQVAFELSNEFDNAPQSDVAIGRPLVPLRIAFDRTCHFPQALAHLLIEKARLAKVGKPFLSPSNVLLRMMAAKKDQNAINDYVAWTIHSSQTIGVKVVNPGGISAFKFNQRFLDLDEQNDYYKVTPREVLKTLARAVHELGVPHPLHIHSSNLGVAGNIDSTLATIDALNARQASFATVKRFAIIPRDGHRAHLGRQLGAHGGLIERQHAAGRRRGVGLLRHAPTHGAPHAARGPGDGAARPGRGRWGGLPACRCDDAPMPAPPDDDLPLRRWLPSVACGCRRRGCR